MRFEKLNENKIRITLTSQDLIKKNVDFHSFMANPIESQSLFFDMLNEAEKQIGFITKNYNIKLEAIQISGGDFVLTVTRSLPESIKNIDNKRKVLVRRKNFELDNNQAVYCFNSFDDFCYFANFLNNMYIKIDSIAKNISLYEYKKHYYLTFSNINLKCADLKKVFSSITEFATYISNSYLFNRKLTENGKIIMKNNAIKTAIKYFVKS